MKKFLTLLLTVVLCFAVCACGGSNSGMDENAEDIIESFFSQSHAPEKVAQLEETCTNYPELTTDEIKALFVDGSRWLEITNEPWTLQEWHDYTFEGGERTLEETFYIPDELEDFEDIKRRDHYNVEKVSVKDDILYFDKDGYKVYKLHDNFYILRNIEEKNFNEWEDTFAYDYVYTPLNDYGSMTYINKGWEEYKVYEYFTKNSELGE